MTEPATGLENIKPLDIEPEVTEVQLEEMIPQPVGYHILVAMPEIEETFGQSGIVKSSQTLRHDTLLTMVGLVIDLGDQAYVDKDRFPNGPWCKQGDYVMFRANSGTRFMVAGTEYRLMNDDTIEAVVANPRGISRVSN